MSLLAPLLFAAATAGGPWTLITKKDDFTDKVSVDAVARGRQGEIFLMVMCGDHGAMDLALGSEKQLLGGEYLSGGTRRVRVDIRIDDRPPLNLEMTGKGQMAFIFGNSAGKRLAISDIKGATSRIRVRTEGRSGISISDELSAKGSARAIESAEGSCRKD